MAAHFYMASRKKQSLRERHNVFAFVVVVYIDALNDPGRTFPTAFVGHSKGVVNIPKGSSARP